MSARLRTAWLSCVGVIRPNASKPSAAFHVINWSQPLGLLWEARPVAYYAWSGVEMHTNATQTARAIAQLYALTGSFDSPGGNVRLRPFPRPMWPEWI